MRPATMESYAWSPWSGSPAAQAPTRRAYRHRRPCWGCQCTSWCPLLASTSCTPGCGSPILRGCSPTSIRTSPAHRRQPGRRSATGAPLQRGVPSSTRFGSDVDDTGMVDQNSTAFMVDHVLLAVDDLAEAAVVLGDRYGLASAEGGHHPRWGTAHRIIPVETAYLELIAVVDQERARDSAIGRWVTNARDGIVQPLGWAVRTAAIEDVARRLDLEIESGSRATPDGGVLQWHLAGVERAAADPALPFFIEWGSGTPHPSQLAVTHRQDPSSS